MKKFLYLYFGGNTPKTAEEGKAAMAAWMAYFGRMGDRIDPRIILTASLVLGAVGAPIGPQKTVGGHAKVPVTGYSLVNAASLEEAVKFTEGHPHIMAGGSIEVCETMPIPM